MDDFTAVKLTVVRLLMQGLSPGSPPDTVKMDVYEDLLPAVLDYLRTFPIHTDAHADYFYAAGVEHGGLVRALEHTSDPELLDVLACFYASLLALAPAHARLKSVPCTVVQTGRAPKKNRRDEYAKKFLGQQLLPGAEVGAEDLYRKMKEYEQIRKRERQHG
jgi:hypothetical protein